MLGNSITGWAKCARHAKSYFIVLFECVWLCVHCAVSNVPFYLQTKDLYILLDWLCECALCTRCITIVQYILFKREEEEERKQNTYLAKIITNIQNIVEININAPFFQRRRTKTIHENRAIGKIIICIWYEASSGIMLFSVTK